MGRDERGWRIEHEHATLLQLLETIDAAVDAVQGRQHVEPGEHDVARGGVSDHVVDRKQRRFDVEVSDGLEQTDVGRREVSSEEESLHALRMEEAASARWIATGQETLRSTGPPTSPTHGRSSVEARMNGRASDALPGPA